ncbi:MAG: PepSY domain-containing protein [Bacilli bacterium]
MNHAFAQSIAALALAGTALVSGAPAFAATNASVTSQSSSTQSNSTVSQGLQTGWQGNQHMRVAPKISSAQASALALSAIPGAVVTKVHLDQENGVPTYSVRTTAAGSVKTVKINGLTGAVEKIKTPGPDAEAHHGTAAEGHGKEKALEGKGSGKVDASGGLNAQQGANFAQGGNSQVNN